MDSVYMEENGVYCLDCTSAVWSTDRMHDEFHTSKVRLSDADFVIENKTHILLVEYKNASIKGAANPNAFVPEEDRKVGKVVQKFYDSLHFLRLLGKEKPVQYIYVLEYPNGDTVTRKRLRNRLKTELPFVLQENIGDGRKLIDKVDVVFQHVQQAF